MSGVTRAFTGLEGDNWFVAGNWASSDFTIDVPGSEDAAQIDSATTNSNSVDIENGDAQAGSVEISQGNELDVGSGGSLTVGSAGVNLVGFALDALVIQSGGVVTVQNGGGITIGENGAGLNGGGKLIIGSDAGSGNGIDGGTLNAAGVVLNTLDSQVVFNVKSGATYTFSVAMSSDGGVLQEGVGTLVILTGDNSYSGVTTISAGTLEIGNGGSSGSLGTGQVDDNFALEFNLSTPTTIANAITGTGSVTFFGPGSYSLSGANTFSGEMTINEGVNVALVGDGTLGDGGVSDLGLFQLAPSGSVTLSNAISGAGGVMLFVDDLTLSGANTYSGETTVGGNGVQTILTAGGDDDLSANSDIDLAAANSILDLNGFDDSIGGLQGDGLVDNMVAKSATLTIKPSALSETYSGQIQNEGGELDLVFNATDARNTLVYTGDDVTTGSTHIEKGILQVGNGGASGSLNGNALTIDANGSLVFDVSSGYGVFNAISGSGDLTFQGGGANFILVNETSYTGQVTVASGTRLDLGNSSALGSLGAAPIVDNGELDLNHSGTFTFDDVISGAGEVQVYGGTEVLKAAASYSGATNILTNTLKAGAANVLSSNSIINVSADAKLDLGAASQTIAGLTGSGTVADEGVGSSILTINDATNTTFTGTLTQVPQLIKKGAGTQILAPGSPFGIVATISAGTLQIGNGGGQQITLGSFTDNAALAFDMSGTIAPFVNFHISGTGVVGFTGNYTFSSSTLSYTGATTINANSSLTLSTGSSFAGGDIVDNGTLTVARTNQTTIGGRISGSGALHVQGGGVALNNALNTVSGGVYIDSGRLSTASDADVDDSLVYFSNGSNAAAWEATGSFKQFAEFIITTGKTVTLEAVAGATMGAFFGGGGGAGITLHIGSTTDTGAVELSAVASLPGGGALSIDGGQADISDADFAALVTSMTGGVTVNGAFTLAGNSLTAYDLRGDGIISDGYNADGTPLSPATLTVFDAESGSAFSGLIDKSLSLVVTGSASIFTLTGDDNASTTVNSGATLQLGDGTTSGSIGGDLADNGILDYLDGSDATFSHKLSGSGTLYKDAASRLTLLGDGSGFNGTVSLDSGLLTLASATALGAAQTVKAFGATLEATVSTSVSSAIAVFAATTFEAAAGATLTLNGPLDDSKGLALHFGSATDTGIVKLGNNGGAGLGAGATIEIDGGTLNVQSNLSLSAARVSFMGTTGKLEFNGVSFVAGDYVTYVGNGQGTGGTLSVRNASGAVIAGVTLSGSYTPLNFALSSDGGTLAITYTAGHPTPTAGDLNGDHKSDLVFESANGLASWRMNDSAIVASGSGNIGNPGSPWTVQGEGDFDGDGKSDILWRNQNGTLDIWEMSGTTIKGGGGIGNPGAQWRVVASGDVNNDGDSDILFEDAAGDLAVWEMNGTTRLAGGNLGNPGAGWKFLGLGDFNGDGKSDALFENANGQYATWLINGTKVIGGATLGALGGDWAFRGLGDFSGDGLSDVLFENVKTGVYATWDVVNDAVSGGGNIGAPGASWAFAGVGDYNGDGKSDILFRNAVSGTYATWDLNDTTISGGGTVGNPGGSFALAGAAPASLSQPAPTLVFESAAGVFATWTIVNGAITGGGALGNPGSVYTELGVGDFYGDGQSDVLFKNANGTYAVWRTNGSAITGGGNIGVATGYTFKGLGDFNGDGLSDLLFENAAGSYATWLMNGTSIIGGGGLGTPGSGFSFAGVGDFTGSGTSDVLFKDGSGNYWTWLINNDGVTSNAEIGNPGAGWSLKGIGDLNGDGKSDLLFENASGTYASWDLNGGAIIGGGTIGNPGSKWKFVGIADLNASNFASIVFSDSGDDVATWLMNDTNIAGGTTLGTASGFTLLAAR